MIYFKILIKSTFKRTLFHNPVVFVIFCLFQFLFFFRSGMEEVVL